MSNLDKKIAIGPERGLKIQRYMREPTTVEIMLGKNMTDL